MTEIFAPESRADTAPKTGAAQTAPTVPTVLERVLGLVAVLALGYCATTLMGAHASDFFGIPPAMMLFCVVVGGLVMSHGAGALGRLLAVCCGHCVSSRVESDDLRGLCPVSYTHLTLPTSDLV